MIAFLLAVALYSANGITVPPVHYAEQPCPGFEATYQPYGRTITNCDGDASVRVMVHELAHHLDNTRLNMGHAGLSAEGFAEATADHLLGLHSAQSEQAWQALEGQ